ncbi:Pentatricopeptide repeat-containing protein 1 mitochondrial [Taenia crassiceps]|uniref:Pentatricopeptide repeat-containing protein 1 mitochondrial n=1 Tax=Taenia crassiceps TaxID=6207 RepID=A0ABR4QK51_9CEST
MLHLQDRSVLFAHMWRLTRQLGSVTAPQLMRLVNDLDKRVYRMQFLQSPTCVADVPVDPSVKSVIRGINISNSESVKFGELADRAGFSESDDFDEFDAAIEESFRDNHLRLSKTGRNHEPAWYLWRINKLCKERDACAAVELFFHKMLTVDRVMPDRNIVHVLLDGLAEVGDSESAFKVYRKMTELGIPATNSTYSRLFRACTEDIATWQREHRYRFDRPSHSKEISSQPDLDLLAGPALARAKGLWVRLHECGFRMNRFTYNTLLQTLAKAGDLHACFRVLDAMLLGRGGLPPSILLSKTAPPVTCSAESLPPFRPDEYTLTAVLTAVLQSFKSGFLVSSLDALYLALHAWHLILPRLPRRQPSLHHFTLLAGIAALSDHRNGRYCLPTFFGSGTGRHRADAPRRNYLEVIPESLPQLRELQSSASPRILASERAANDLLRRMALLASGDGIPSQISTNSTSFNGTSLAPISSDSHNLLPNTFCPDWTDPDIVMRSPVNLLLPLPQEGVRIQVPTRRDRLHIRNPFPPWQRLALFGGLEGFLECIKTHFKLSQTPTSPLITKVATLLPPPSENAGAELDRWERALLSAMDASNVILDLPILNALLQRRTTHGLPVNKLMAIANRQGLSPDEFTWSCLARGCRTTKHVRDFLTSYSKAAKPMGGSELPACLGTVRPSLHVYATLLASTKFYWNSKIIIIRSMMGSGQLTSKSKEQREDGKEPADSQPYDSPILPNRRLIANLELEIAHFRDLVARGIVPKDGSSVEACDQTGGVIIPPYSLRAFKKFLPIYKEWAEQTVVADPSSTSMPISV